MTLDASRLATEQVKGLATQVIKQLLFNRGCGCSPVSSSNGTVSNAAAAVAAAVINDGGGGNDNADGADGGEEGNVNAANGGGQEQGPGDAIPMETQ